MTVFTIGHSTHSHTELIELLAVHGVTRLADVRTVPRSRRTPQFNREELSEALPAVGVDYVHIAELGGWRSPRPGSERGAGWRNRSFRGYADHMASEEFRAGLAHLLGPAGERSTAMMCAEAVWWRCHRRMIADALVARSLEVCHIGPDGRLAAHVLTEFAMVGEDGEVSYPAGGRRAARLPGRRRGIGLMRQREQGAEPSSQSRDFHPAPDRSG